VLTVQQVAVRLNVCDDLVYDWCNSGMLPHFRLGRKGRRGGIRIEEGALEAFLTTQKQEERQPPRSPAPRRKPVKLANLRLKLS